MRRAFKAIVMLAGAIALYQVTAGASGSSIPSGGSSSPTVTPEERAAESYNNGLEHRDKGKKLEDQAVAKSGSERQKLEEKARGEFEKALKDFKRAADISPKSYQAFNGMGYAYRKTGDYVKALEMYDKALQMAPGFPEATEYRGEAYLALNRLDDAKNAYLELLGSDRAQAELLMTAMKGWIEKRRADAGGVDPQTISSFEAWVKERSEVAKETASMALTGHRRSW